MENKTTILLTAVNSRYTHTNLAVRYLSHALNEEGIDNMFREYNINRPVREILADIEDINPKILSFSVYIWNADYTLKISKAYSLMHPETKIILGGPEVSYNPSEILSLYPHISAVICGEGEKVLPRMLKEGTLEGIFQSKEFVNMDDIPFPYDDLDALAHRVLYYESTRGCPFGCAY